MVAPNGARKVKTDHPQVPLDAGEIAAVARDCADAGAGAIHYHVRDTEGDLRIWVPNPADATLVVCGGEAGAEFIRFNFHWLNMLSCTHAGQDTRRTGAGYSLALK